jgi:KDO2-lipid IV(A) lauroyltransferase
LRERVQIVNADTLTRFTRAGQTVILLASHHCNWEWLLLAGCLEPGVRVDAVYKPLRVAIMDRFFLEMRSRFGGQPISVKDLTSAALGRRGAARVLALAADQTPTWNEKKRWTRFLNQDTAFFVGADRIARITRAPVFFAGMRRVRRGYYEARLQLLAEPPYSGTSDSIIERYARAAEAHITAHPADWLWMYRKWKYQKPPV